MHIGTDVLSTHHPHIHLDMAVWIDTLVRTPSPLFGYRCYIEVTYIFNSMENFCRYMVHRRARSSSEQRRIEAFCLHVKHRFPFTYAIDSMSPATHSDIEAYTSLNADMNAYACVYGPESCAVSSFLCGEACLMWMTARQKLKRKRKENSSMPSKKAGFS